MVVTQELEKKLREVFWSAVASTFSCYVFLLFDLMFLSLKIFRMLTDPPLSGLSGDYLKSGFAWWCDERAAHFSKKSEACK